MPPAASSRAPEQAACPAPRRYPATQSPTARTIILKENGLATAASSRPCLETRRVEHNADRAAILPCTIQTCRYRLFTFARHAGVVERRALTPRQRRFIEIVDQFMEQS